jgi:hypothetical protein
MHSFLTYSMKSAVSLYRFPLVKLPIKRIEEVDVYLFCALL